MKWLASPIAPLVSYSWLGLVGQPTAPDGKYTPGLTPRVPVWGLVSSDVVGGGGQL